MQAAAAARLRERVDIPGEPSGQAARDEFRRQIGPPVRHDVRVPSRHDCRQALRPATKSRKTITAARVVVGGRSSLIVEQDDHRPGRVIL